MKGSNILRSYQLLSDCFSRLKNGAISYFNKNKKEIIHNIYIHRFLLLVQILLIQT